MYMYYIYIIYIFNFVIFFIWSVGSSVPPSEAGPVRALPPRAQVCHDDLGAVVAVHRAAPVEFAVAAAHRVHAPLVHAQAAFVAQPAAAAPLPRGEPVSVLHALPALGAVQAHAGVPPAVVRGVLQVEELRLRDAAERVHHGAPVVRAVAGAHALSVHVQLLRLVVLAPQVVADLSEVGQLRPAGLDTAALRHAVTSADALHRCLHCLLETTVNHRHPLKGDVTWCLGQNVPAAPPRCCAG